MTESCHGDEAVGVVVVVTVMMMTTVVMMQNDYNGKDVKRDSIDGESERMALIL